MKTNFFFLIFILCSTIGLAQDFSESQDSIIYLTNNDEVFLLDKKTRIAVKTTPLSVEAKIGKAFSIIPQIEHLSNVNYFAVEGRYYYQMANRIKAGLQANNISGRYISALYHRRETRLSYGFQQRVMNRCYIDLGLRLSRFERVRQIPHTTAISLSTYANFGLIIGKKHSIDPDKVCSVVRCHSNRKNAWRINLSRLLSITREGGSPNENGSFWSFELNPEITFEQKILNSSFSVESYIQGDWRFNTINNTNSNNSATVSVGVKYFYEMSRKILKGKSGNNLSGNFFFLRNVHIQFEGDNYGATEFGYGYQQELVNRLFFEAAIFGRVRNYGLKNDSRLGLRDEDIGVDFTLSYIFN